MTSTSDVEGVKISNISLANPQSNGRSEFYVEIKFRGKTETSMKTEKKRLDGDRLIWNVSFSFAGCIANSVVIFQVFKTHLLHREPVGTFEKGIAELLSLQSNSGSCTLDMGGESGQLTFSIELQSGILADVVAQASEAANVIPSARDTFLNRKDTWSSFLTQFQIFLEVVDKIAEVHPYATLAWNILSIIPKTFMSLKFRNENVKQLCEKLKETYDFIIDSKRLPELSKTQGDLVLRLVQQTIECGYFIREYSRGKIVERIWKGAKLDDKIKAFIDQFDHMQKAMNNSTTLETSIATLRISETIDETKELTLLNEMPYAQDAGFVTGKRCLPGTRQGLIQEIMGWANDDTAQQILVLSGAAGTGKSAVAHTIAEIFWKQNRLGSLFCFNRSYKDRRNSLFSTISRGLADTDVLWRKGLIKIIEETAIRKSTDMEKQFEELIVKPSRETAVVGPVVIVIDALDESGEREERQALLDILFGQLSKLPTNYRILLTTRPETDIEPRCQSSTAVCKRMADIALDGTLSDIRSYVSFRLKNIAATLDEIQSDWRDVLAKRSEGLFQWAETVCRFINPTVRDPALVEKRWNTFTSGSSTSLYELYHDIISSQEEVRDSDFTNDFKKIISAIMTAREPLTVHALNALFQDIRSVQMKLEPFGSLFLGVHDSSTPVRPLHTSLFDFFHSPVQNEAKHNQYYVDTSDQSAFALGCLRLLNRTLQFNICNLETSHLRNRDIPDLDVRVEKTIPLELSYSCRFWAFHLQDSRNRRDLVPELRTLIHEKILYLFEALSLLGSVNTALVAMRIVSSWCKDVNNGLAEEALDAWHFGLDFGEMMTESTPHLYLSALPFTPSNSFISKRFIPMYPRLLSFEVGHSLGSPTQTGLVKRKHPPSWVELLVFSPQDKHIATAFSDGTLWIWDYETGEMIREWKSPHERSYISDIIFSPDGQLVYWCFDDATVKICNVWTKEVVEESYQEVHDNESSSGSKDFEELRCTIASDGRYIALSVGDKLVLYDRENHRKLTQFEYPSYLHCKPAFSPNGDMFACPMHTVDGEELCLWDTRTRRQALKFRLKIREGALVPMFALSDKHLAFKSSFNDRDIEVWDIPTLTKVCTITTNCSCQSSSFINDEYLATSYNGYSIWNVSTGECIVETSLTDIWVSAVAFHESKLIVAVGTEDGAVHVRPLDTPAESKTLDDVMMVESREFWLRGRYLIQLYLIPSDYRYHLLRISDIKTVNNIVFEAQTFSEEVSPSDLDGHVYVAYCTCDSDGNNKLHLWSDVKGDFILDEGKDIVPRQFSSAGDRLISIEGNVTVKIWDTFTRALIGGSCRIRPNPYTVFTAILAFSARSDDFLVAYESSKRTFRIEVRECRSGRISRGPFEISEYPHRITSSADGTRIIYQSYSHVNILDAQTGKKELSISELSLPQLSPNRKYVAWFLNRADIMIWDIDHGVQLQLSINGYVRNFFFSDDSAQIMALYDGDDDEYHFDIRDISTRKTTCRVTGIYTAPGKSTFYPVPLSDGDHFAFIPDDYHVATSLDLSVYKIMSSLYEHHRKSSRFGMLPIDHSETRQEIQALNGSTSDNKEILEYALTAWNKALFSQAFQREDSAGWILGPHGELLFWVPENRRHALWRPCVNHIAARHFIKLNFDRFAHGSRWTECLGTSA